MKKALIVANLFGFVGFLWNDIRILQSMGYEVTYAAHDNIGKDDGIQMETLLEKGVKFCPLRMASKNPLSRENFAAYTQIRKLLAEGDYDLVHCHTPIAGFLTRMAAREYRRHGLKVIYTTHGFSFCRYSGRTQWIFYFWLERIASLFTDLIITINEEDRQNAERLFCKNVRKINGVGVDTKRYHDVQIDTDAYKRNLGLPTDKIMVLSVGELSARKNHQVIIRALGLLPNKSDYIYVICGRENGSTAITQLLKSTAEEYGVELHLLGHRHDIPEIMHCADLGAIPSVREGLGLAGIQSLCAEVPLVGTDVQGIKEYILDDVTGYLCSPYDAEGYAKAIQKLSDPDISGRMKQNCYDIAKQFDIHISKQQMKESYTFILR